MKTTPAQEAGTYWAFSKEDLLKQLVSSAKGLTQAEAGRRSALLGPNTLSSTGKKSLFVLYFNQFKSPITLILLFAAGLSVFLGDVANTLIIFAIILISSALSFWQEMGARGAVEKLLSIIRIDTSVLRDGKQQEIPLEQVVRGDVVMLRAGDIIPGDCVILEAKDLFVNEATLTGETFPVEKTEGASEPGATLARRYNTLFMGTHVVSGTVTAIVVLTGVSTQIGVLAKHLSRQAPETDFERGIRKFGLLLMELTVVLVLAIFAINIYFHKPVIDSLLFSLALAVGLTPQLLPAIISVNLSEGAKRIAKSKVIVKRLSSIENFGSMNILCSDKTGTLTVGDVRVSAFLSESADEQKLMRYTYLNSFFETGFKNPLDAAILRSCSPGISQFEKADEIPYDFIRKRLSIVVKSEGKYLMITKGAFQQVLDCCTHVEKPTGVETTDHERQMLSEQFEGLSKRGLRVIALAYKELPDDALINKQSEQGMTFLGMITFYDPAKPGISSTIYDLTKLGIELKIITGDNKFIAAELGKTVFPEGVTVLTGREMLQLSDEALTHKAQHTNVFAEVEPNQKERILLALKRSGNVVGYLGDGINDASALRAADVGISVDTAVDVAKESADIVLLDKDLSVLLAGVKEGRRTFANTLKYILMATSANFGNMFSMAGASLFLPFLPLLPFQILLTNLLTDLPEMTIASDNVDERLTAKPRRWDLSLIRRFMTSFGLLSSFFDYATFGVLLLVLHASQDQFRTGWFLESVLSASLIVLVVRSPLSLFRSRPGKYLVITTLLAGVLTVLLTFTGLSSFLGFTSLPPVYLLALAGIVLLYLLSAEFLKKIIYAKLIG